MKTVRIIMFLCVLLSFVFIASAECRWYETLGSSNDPSYRTSADYVLMIKLIDPDTHIPIQGAKIVLYENDMPIVTLVTDRGGIGIVLIDHLGYIDGSWRIKVTSEKHRYWETELDEHDFERVQFTRMIRLPNQENIINADGTTRVTDQMLLSALKSGRYELVNQDRYSWSFPALLEFTVKMEKVGHRRNHQRDEYERVPDDEDQEDSRYEESDEEFFAGLIREADAKYREKEKRDKARYIEGKEVFARYYVTENNPSNEWPPWRDLPWYSVFRYEGDGGEFGWWYFVFRTTKHHTEIIFHVEPCLTVTAMPVRFRAFCSKFGTGECAALVQLVEGKDNIWGVLCER